MTANEHLLRMYNQDGIVKCSCGGCGRNHFPLTDSLKEGFVSSNQNLSTTSISFLNNDAHISLTPCAEATFG